MLAAADAVGAIILLLLIVVALAIYFLPSIVAFRRQHHQAGAVFAINLLLGWSLIGWAVALAMALSAQRQPPVIVSQYAPGPAQPPGAPQAGWYPDPSGNGQLRYWTGAAWGPSQPPQPPAAPRDS